MSSIKELRLAVSSKSLERMLYYNKYFSIMFGVILIFQAMYRQFYLIQFPKSAIVGPVFCFSWPLIEFLRIRVGSFGNKHESVR